MSMKPIETPYAMGIIRNARQSQSITRTGLILLHLPLLLLDMLVTLRWLDTKSKLCSRCHFKAESKFVNNYLMFIRPIFTAQIVRTMPPANAIKPTTTYAMGTSFHLQR